MHYLSLIATLPTEAPIYLVEWPHVSMQVTGGSVPSIETTVETIRARLKADGFDRACFVGHSLGSHIPFEACSCTAPPTSILQSLTIPLHVSS